MNLTNNPLPLFAAIMAGIVAQQVLAWLKKRDRKAVYRIARPLVLLYWIGLGLVMMVGGAGEAIRNNVLIGMSEFALGLGLMISGLGQTLDRKWLRTIGITVLAVGPIVAGIGFMVSGNSLSGMIALALGVGILASSLQGWISGIGQMVVGAIVLGSSAMMLIGTFITSTAQPDLTTGVIAAAMFLVGLAAIVGGILAVIGSIRQTARADPSTA